MKQFHDLTDDEFKEFIDRVISEIYGTIYWHEVVFRDGLDWERTVRRSLEELWLFAIANKHRNLQRPYTTGTLADLGKKPKEP